MHSKNKTTEPLRALALEILNSPGLQEKIVETSRDWENQFLNVGKGETGDIFVLGLPLELAGKVSGLNLGQNCIKMRFLNTKLKNIIKSAKL